MSHLYTKYGYTPSSEKVSRSLELIAQNLEGLSTPEVLKACFSMMDLTTLHTTDTPSSVGKLVDKVNALGREYPAYPAPASICVYPLFAPVVRKKLTAAGVHVTVVSGCFPTSQTFIESKVFESRLAVQRGADEVDIVLALNSFLTGDFETAGGEIAAIRRAVDEEGEKLGRKIILKVILETGILVTEENIADASFLAMENGADFIKTSTGKVEVNATPTAAYVMCESIAHYYKATGRKVGFKAAGGISTSADAACYYSIVSTLLGKEWLSADLFRFGVSRLANSLMSSIEQQTVAFF